MNPALVPTPTHEWQVGSGRPITLLVTLDDAASCAHPGDCGNDVRELSLCSHITTQTEEWDPEELAAELDEYGAWDEYELSDHEQNIQRMLWIACNDVAESPDVYRLD